MRRIYLIIASVLIFAVGADAQLYHAAKKLRHLKEIGSASKQTTQDSLIIRNTGVRIVNGLKIQSTIEFTSSVSDSLAVLGGTAFGYDGGNNSWFFQNVGAGENPLVYIYGDNSGTPNWGTIGISTDGNLIIRAQNAGFLGGAGQSTVLFSDAGLAVIDDKAYRIGSDLDAELEYDGILNNGLIFGIPVTGKRGLVIKDKADMANDYTGLVGTTNFPDVHFIDTDEDSKIKVGWSADDTPEITANRDLDLQLTGDVGLNLFRSSGVGENPEFRIYGDEGGTPTYSSLKVAAGGNMHILSTGNIELYGQSVLIGLMSNKWIQMLDQRGIVWGTDSQGDFRTMWDDSAHASGTNEAMLMGISKSRGIIIGDQGLMNGNGGDAYDLTSLLTGRFDQASLMMLDDDRDSYLQFYHYIDDVPTIKSPNTIIIDTPTGITIGKTGLSEIRPTFSIIAEADDDAEDTDETFSITLVPNADPTLAPWRASTEQSVAGFDFDMPLTAATVSVDNMAQAVLSGTGSTLTIDTDEAMSFETNADMDGVFVYRFTPATSSIEMNASSGEQKYFNINPRIDQTGTASYVALVVDVLEEDATASGQDLLMDLRLIQTPKFTVQTDGVTIFTAAPVFASYTRHHDLQIGAAVLGPNAPDAITTGTSRGFGFDADNEAVFVAVEVPSEWDGASNFSLNIHWNGENGDAVANTEKVKWDAHYHSVVIGEAVDNGTLVTATTTFTGGASEGDKETYQTVLTIVYTGGNQPLTVGDQLYIQIDRDVTGEAGGGGGYSGQAIITSVELEYTAIALATH